MTTTTALILTAGANSRFFPLNYSTHKGAISLMGEPLILRTIRTLESVGIQKVVIVLSEKDMLDHGLRDFLQEQQVGVELVFVMQSEPKGMGDAVLTAREHVGDRFIVTYPNAFDIKETIEEMVKMDSPEVMCSSVTEEPWLYGILTVEDKKAVSIIEKPNKGEEPSQYKVEGLYVLSQEFIQILESLPVSEYNYEEALDILMKKRPIPLVIKDENLLTFKYPWHLFETQGYLFSTLTSQTDSSATVAKTAIIDDSHGPVVIEAGARVGDFAKIVGPAYIGKDALVGDYSFVRGSSLEAGVQVGAKTEVVRSILLEDATIHFGYLADSIIGKNTWIGAGLITANKRHDRQTVQVEVKGQKVDSRREGLGVIIGEESRIGIASRTLPGKMIGAKAFLYPSVSVYQNIPHGAVVKNQESIVISEQ